MAEQQRIVIVGNGMVGYKLCEQLTNRTGDLAITVFGEEPRPAYDRVHLTEYLATGSADGLTMADRAWYSDKGITLRTDAKVVSIDRDAKTVCLESGEATPYDLLVLATGSAPFVPGMPGIKLEGVFVYRTIEDLDAIKNYAATKAKKAAVLGGGLLGLEAARAVQELGLVSHVVEMAPRLMPRQLDATGSRLLERAIKSMGITIHLGKAPKQVCGETAVTGIEMADGAMIDVDMLVVSAGIKPRDELARASGLAVGERGGIVVDGTMRTNDPSIFAIGECALFRGMIYGLVAPGYEMASLVADQIVGKDTTFDGADMSTKLKLLGTDVASLGDPFAESDDVLTVSYTDLVKGVYKKVLVHAETKKVVGAVLVGDTNDYGSLLHFVKSGETLPVDPDALILPQGGGSPAKLETPDTATICSCNNVSKGAIKDAIKLSCLSTIKDVKKCSNAGTGCGGCLPQVTQILNAEMAARGDAVKPRLCEHFAYTRTELYAIVRAKGFKTFEELLATHGTGLGCEICKPTAASILASIHNEWILRHASLQDTNDRFLANIQRQGTYSVVPRIPGGEITPDKLIAIGEVGKKYGLYTKITGGQRIDLFGARVDQLPDIWEELVKAGFESGHAYGKSLRTVKSCVGSTWCRYGVQDSVGFAIRVENRYKGLRSPHKLKSAVSGCVRECAEAQSKDFGLIATERGYNLYVCGNGGSKPRHADLLASDLDEATAIQYIDRFLMYYVQTADRLTRTSVWLDGLEGGIEHLRDVVVRDTLGIAAELEQQMQNVVDTYQCEWTSVVNDPVKRATFRHFSNDDAGDPTLEFVSEREQIHPVDWSPRTEFAPKKFSLPVIGQSSWVRAMRVDEVPRDGGIAFKHGLGQIAVYHLAATGAWYATDNACPHTGDQVLARGILGDQGGIPKVACPQHKKSFDLTSGACLGDEPFAIRTYPVKVDGGYVYLELPPASAFDDEACGAAMSCSAAAAE